ncbi:uncharacterized protein MKK02DRAFT_33850 [Dioszegia hungarica]|uniref:Uncharacterized protein n=1 Tax=Dioszegia hungarica TaxID=4972 RepID=A0AA38HBW0_9TREE|nr:uncharacterized protein MKK02DRAFT_33850 [Dioszegia hungarica]KAI9636724.1 hypothetical protein MKK02DRAFT_33850 [Dioszegia hungarica]
MLLTKLILTLPLLCTILALPAPQSNSAPPPTTEGTGPTSAASFYKRDPMPQTLPPPSTTEGMGPTSAAGLIKRVPQADPTAPNTPTVPEAGPTSNKRWSSGISESTECKISRHANFVASDLSVPLRRDIKPHGSAAR